MKYFLVYPHQLYKELLQIPSEVTLVFIEDPHFFSVYTFHKHKLLLHRASMKYMEERCRTAGQTTKYVEFHELQNSQSIFDRLKDISSIELFDPVDHQIEQAVRASCEEHNILLHIVDTPGFLLQKSEIDELLPESKTHYSPSSFYSSMRKKFNIFIDQNNKPFGGKWSPKIEKKVALKDLVVPKLPRVFEGFELDEAKEYVQHHFPGNHGDINTFYLPTNHTDALPWLVTFNHTRLEYYGDFEATVDVEHPFLFHSVLSPLLNIGLITPRDVIDHVLEYISTHEVPYTSIENFLRQVLGWREFMRGVYAQKSEYMRSENIMESYNELPAYMYSAESGLPPLDTTIRRVLQHGYCSHLERLMILGNFMLLTHISPDKVHQWFMEMFVDSYDWATVPNVYALSQFATGPLISTKPYTSGSAYILRMSNYPKGEWTEVWDGLFWKFIERHKTYYKSNFRIKMMPKVLRRMSKERKKELWQAVDEWNSRHTTS